MKAVMLLTAVLTGIAVAQQSAPPDGALLVGATSREGVVRILKLDNGARHWDFGPTGRKTTGSSITVLAGHYELVVLCMFPTQGVAAEGVKTISVDAGHTYQINGTLSSNKKACNVVLAPVS